MRKTKQLSIFGKRLTRVNFRSNEVATPTMIPKKRLPKKTPRKVPILSKKVNIVRLPPVEEFLYL